MFTKQRFAKIIAAIEDDGTRQTEINSLREHEGYDIQKAVAEIRSERNTIVVDEPVTQEYYANLRKKDKLKLRMVAYTHMEEIPEVDYTIYDEIIFIGYVVNIHALKFMKFVSFDNLDFKDNKYFETLKDCDTMEQVNTCKLNIREFPKHRMKSQINQEDINYLTDSINQEEILINRDVFICMSTGAITDVSVRSIESLYLSKVKNLKRIQCVESEELSMTRIDQDFEVDDIHCEKVSLGMLSKFTSYNAFSCVRDLTISECSLFTGKDVLFKCDAISIISCESFEDMNCVDGVDDITFLYCANLKEIIAFKKKPSQFTIACNHKIKSIDNLNGIEKVSIRGLDEIEDISPLKNSSDVLLEGLSKVDDISSLEGVNTVELVDMNSVKDFTPLGKSYTVSIDSCENFNSVKGLQNITNLTITDPQHSISFEPLFYSHQMYLTVIHYSQPIFPEKYSMLKSLRLENCQDVQGKYLFKHQNLILCDCKGHFDMRC